MPPLVPYTFLHFSCPAANDGMLALRSALHNCAPYWECSGNDKYCSALLCRIISIVTEALLESHHVDFAWDVAIGRRG